MAYAAGQLLAFVVCFLVVVWAVSDGALSKRSILVLNANGSD
ncbi:hypothetical protein [Mesorhizobium sp. ANAO-SY3R2]